MRLALVASLVFSTTAFACPQLAGNYSLCRSTTGQSGGSRDMIVTQSTVSGGATQYSVTSTDEETQERSTDSIITDGVPRTQTETDPQSGLTFITNTVARCVGNTLELTMKTTVQGQSFAEIKSVVQKNGSQLITTVNGQMMGQSVSDTTVCQ